MNTVTQRERELELLVISLSKKNQELEQLIEKEKKSNMSFIELLDMFINEKQMAISTKCGYVNIVSNHLKPYFATKDVKINDFNIFVVDEYIKYKQLEGLSNQTIKHHINVMKSAFTFGRKKGMTITSKVETSIKLLVDPYKFDVLSFEEILEYIKALENTDLYLPVLLSSMLGLRRSEVVGLKWKYVNFKTNEIYIHGAYIQCMDSVNKISYEYYENNTKTKSSTRVYIAPIKLMDELRKYKERQLVNSKKSSYNFTNAEYICVKNNGDLIKPNYITKKHRILVKKIFPDKHIRFHDLRHSCATFLYEKFKYGIKDIQTYLGHSNPNFTVKTYIHTTTERKLDISNKIDKNLNLG